MVLRLNKRAYEKLIQEDIAALQASDCEKLEREHIIHVLQHSIGMYYPSKPPLSAIGPLNDHLLDILGRPNYSLHAIAEIMRRAGKSIPNKAEVEQAHVIYWMLELYLNHGDDWRLEGGKHLKDMLDKLECKAMD